VTGLSPTGFTHYADQCYAEARQTIEVHAISAYTGLCLGCGRPGPCADLTAAQQQAHRYSRPGLPPPPAGPPPQAVAVISAAGTMNDLRQAALAITAATDRAAAQLDGVHHLHRRIAPWHAALTDGWQALGLVHAGLAHARRLPDTPGGSAAELLAELGTARADADWAGTLAAGVRLRLTVAEDQLRRTGRPAALVAARNWAVAIARLDLLVARLAVGGRALDQYAGSLTGAPTRTPRVLPARPRGPVAEIAPAATAVAKLVASARRRNRPSLWATVRHHLRLETRP
jgi:hypothetical protein